MDQPIELGTASLWLEKYKQLQADIKNLEEQLANARRHIEEALGDNSIGLSNGKPAVKWVWVESTRFDQKKAKEILDSETLTRCMTTQRIRRFDVVREDAQ